MLCYIINGLFVNHTNTDVLKEFLINPITILAFHYVVIQFQGIHNVSIITVRTKTLKRKNVSSLFLFSFSFLFWPIESH